MNFSRLKIEGMLFVAAGVVVLLCSTVSWFHTRSYLHGATKLQVTVARLFEGYKGTHYSTTLYFPVYWWEDAEGHDREIYSSIGSHPAAYKPDDKVTLLYNPDSPRDSKPLTFWNVWSYPIELLSIGIASLLFGGIVLLFARAE